MVASWGLMCLPSASRIALASAVGPEPAYLCTCMYVYFRILLRVRVEPLDTLGTLQKKQVGFHLHPDLCVHSLSKAASSLGVFFSSWTRGELPHEKISYAGCVTKIPGRIESIIVGTQMTVGRLIL